MFIKTKLIIEDKELDILANSPGSLLEIIVQAGVEIDAPCAGLGKCGKCRVKIYGELNPDSVEKELLTNSELEAGIRLACRKRKINRELVIYIQKEEARGFSEISVRSGMIMPCDIGVAVDLGSTTISLAFIDLSNDNIISMRSLLNPQRIYGADVVSRIKACLDKSILDKMSVMTADVIRQGIGVMLMEIGLGVERIRSVTIAGNTTMEHILAGIDVSGLAKAPYKPAFREMRKVSDFKKLLAVTVDDIRLFPIVGGFIGGDTVASILAGNMDISDEVTALIDLGTNAEIVIGNKSQLFVTSAPAGPAFEGGEIKQGMRAGNGAIENIYIADDNIKLYVKGDAEPKGICGSGLIAIVGELIKAGIVTTDGELLDSSGIPNNLSIRSVNRNGEQAFLLYKSFNHEVYLYQSDIRALQLAKASIAAGLNMMIKLAGVKPSKLYLAGAFGNYLRPDALQLIGMIPSDLALNTYFIGDSVISGLKRFIINKPNVDMGKLLSAIKHIELADDPSFNRQFLSMLEFKRGKRGSNLLF